MSLKKKKKKGLLVLITFKKSHEGHEHFFFPSQLMRLVYLARNHGSQLRTFHVNATKDYFRKTLFDPGIKTM